MVFRVIKNENYTTMCNHHLKNRNLSLKAKGLMSLILSLPDSWDYTLKGLASICREGVDCIGAAVNELISEGYIVRSRERDEKGRLTGCVYDIHEIPESGLKPDFLPERENPDMDENEAFKASEPPKRENPVQVKSSPEKEGKPPKRDFPVLDNPRLENPVQSNTELINNTKLINNLSINQLSPVKHTDDMIDEIDETDDSFSGTVNCVQEHFIGEIEEMVSSGTIKRRKDEVREMLSLMLDMDAWKEDEDMTKRRMATELYELICQNVISPPEKTLICGSEVSGSALRKRMLVLNYMHLEYVINSIMGTEGRIKNIRKYMITALYNAPATFATYAANEYGVRCPDADLELLTRKGLKGGQM